MSFFPLHSLKELNNKRKGIVPEKGINKNIEKDKERKIKKFRRMLTDMETSLSNLKKQNYFLQNNKEKIENEYED